MQTKCSTQIKDALHRMRVYQLARWARRHVWDRDELVSERRDLGVYAAFIRPGDIVFDVGANVGEKSRLFLKLGARVVAFEPQPDCRQELVRRCGANSDLTVIDSAVGSEHGRARLYVREHSGASGLVADWEKSPVKEEIEVEVATLAEAIQQHGAPRFIKIDIEGYEYEAIKGLCCPIEYVSFEYHLTTHTNERNEEDIQKSVKCIEHLEGLSGEVRLNVSAAKSMKLQYDRWVTKDEFLSDFLLAEPDSAGSRVSSAVVFDNYGDIFVKSNV